MGNVGIAIRRRDEQLALPQPGPELFSGVLRFLRIVHRFQAGYQPGRRRVIKLQGKLSQQIGGLLGRADDLVATTNVNRGGEGKDWHLIGNCQRALKFRCLGEGNADQGLRLQPSPGARTHVMACRSRSEREWTPWTCIDLAVAPEHCGVPNSECAKKVAATNRRVEREGFQIQADEPVGL